VERQFSTKTWKGWAQASSLLVKTSHLPILEHILIDNDRIVLGTREAMLEWQMEEADHAPGWLPMAIPARDLEKIVKVLPDDGVVSLRNDGTVRCGKSRFQLPTLPGQDYPIEQDRIPERWFSCDRAEFDRFSPSVRRFAAIKDSRIYLNGVHWVLVNGKLRMEATDGHRAIRVEIPLPGTLDLGGEAGPLDTILPTEPLASWSKLLQTQPGDQFAFAFRQPLFWLQAGALRMRISPVDGRYPDMDRVLPKIAERPLELRCPSEELQGSLATAEIAIEKDRVIFLDLQEDELCITGRSQEKMAESRLEASWSGDGVRKAFDSKYLRSMVDSYREWEPEETDVSLRMGPRDTDSCILATEYGCMVTMPIRV